MKEIDKYIKKHYKEIVPLQEKDLVIVAYNCFVNNNMLEPTIQALTSFAKYLSEKGINTPTLYNLNDWKDTHINISNKT